MQTQAIIEKLDFLPSIYQQQIVEYIDFMTNKYLKSLHNESKTNNEITLTDDLVKLLDYSVEHHKNNMDKAKTSEGVFSKVAKKYNYEL